MNEIIDLIIKSMVFINWSISSKYLGEFTLEVMETPIDELLRFSRPVYLHGIQNFSETSQVPS